MGDASLNTQLKGDFFQRHPFSDNNNVASEAVAGKDGRTKKFISYDSLRYEKERLETFIDWPVDWMKPEELAHDGFYYLRTADHCACVFCRGIVGAWERGDTPREEHRRHFPQCPFIKGQPVGNIPLTQSMILSHFAPSTEAVPPRSLCTDVCGTGRPMPGSYPDNQPPKKTDLILASMGLPQHSGPKRRDFLAVDKREDSFVRWPDKVKQTPKELAEAGFFYCGLSDHVRCFHCGNGLRNWEREDDPWEEHARWYPECNYVLVKKGQEFIDKVRREKPPYLRSQPAQKASSSLARPSITEKDLDQLMELDIIKATVGMGFPPEKVRPALRRKLEQTGLPFFNLEACIEAVLQYMEEETRQTLRESSARSLEMEAASQQGAKMQVLQSQREGQETESSSSSNLTTTTTTTTTTQASATAVSSSASALPASSAQSPSQNDTGASNTEEPMETESPPITPTHDVLTLADRVIGMAEQALSAAPTSSSSPTPNPSAGSSLVTSTTSTPSSAPAATAVAAAPASGSIPAALPTLSNSSDAVMEKVTKNTEVATEESSATGKPLSFQDLTIELERLKESQTCKVCMDAKIDMVFLPCSHMVTCSSCALALNQCPICRTDIKYAIKTILS